jgi:hypothetical protein
VQSCAFRDLLVGHLHTPNPVREKSNFARLFRLIWAVQSLAQKYSTFAFSEFGD